MRKIQRIAVIGGSLVFARSERKSMSKAIARVTSILCLPYGYTVTLWCAGAVTIADYGLPGRVDVLAFATGAVAAFLLCAGVGRAHLDGHVPMRVPSTAVVNVFPVLVGVLLAVLPLNGLGKPAAFLTTSFVATAAYIACLAILVRESATPASLDS
jgi:hypothetical protein